VAYLGSLVVYATQKTQYQWENIWGKTERSQKFPLSGRDELEEIERLDPNKKAPSFIKNGLFKVKELRQPGNRLS